MSVEALSRMLWRERELLELLLFKLEEEQLVLAAGRNRWLAHATREVEMVLAQIREVELTRAVHSDAAASDLGLPPGASLRAIGDAAPTPWGDLMRGHREAFLQITSEISALAQDNRDLVAQGARATREALVGMALGSDDAGDTYGPGGRTMQAARPILVDEAL